MKRLTVVVAILSIICITTNNNHAQHWVKTYDGGYYDSPHTFQQTSDDGYIIVGETTSFDSDEFFWLLKLGSNGDTTWQKTYSGINYPRFIQQTSDGGYITGGVTSSFGVNSTDIWLLKLDGNGSVLWQKAYGGNNSDHAFSIQQTSDGGYIVAGSTSSFNVAFRDVWLLKLDSNGDITWQKTYGGNSGDYAYFIQQTSDGGFIVAGTTESFGVGFFQDFWVLKLDSSGGITWQKTYGGSGSDTALCIQQTSEGGYIVGGRTSSFGAGSSDAWLLKLDSSGGIIWQKTYGGSKGDAAISIQQTSDGGYIVAGNTSSFSECFYHSGCHDSWVFKLDENGGIVWESFYYGGLFEDYALSIKQTSDGGYAFVGTSNTSNPNRPNTDNIRLLKLNNNGLIPNCDIVNTTTATITDTSAVVQDTTATIQTSSAVITVTNAIPQDTESEVLDCPPFDYDSDGIIDVEDNCPDTSNQGQIDSCPPQGNGIGDDCDCEGDFDCDGDCDGADASTFKVDFGRSTFQRPCINEDPCNGDFSCDGDVDGADAALFKEDFGRSPFGNPCPVCMVGGWCSYPSP